MLAPSTPFKGFRPGQCFEKDEMSATLLRFGFQNTAMMQLPAKTSPLALSIGQIRSNFNQPLIYAEVVGQTVERYDIALNKGKRLAGR
jgi:hypothetical protein